MDSQPFPKHKVVCTKECEIGDNGGCRSFNPSSDGTGLCKSCIHFEGCHTQKPEPTWYVTGWDADSESIEISLDTHGVMEVEYPKWTSFYRLEFERRSSHLVGVLSGIAAAKGLTDIPFTDLQSLAINVVLKSQID